MYLSSGINFWRQVLCPGISPLTPAVKLENFPRYGIKELINNLKRKQIYTVDPRLTAVAPLTDFLSYRLLWLQNLGSTCSRKIDLQTGGEKKSQNGTKTPCYGLISFQCIVGQWSLDLQTFRPAATIPIRINSVNRGSTVTKPLSYPALVEHLYFLKKSVYSILNKYFTGC